MARCKCRTPLGTIHSMTDHNTALGAPEPQPQAPPPPPAVHKLSFHGTGGAFFLLMLRNLVLTILTVGFYTPWARTQRRFFIWQNVEIGGHRLRYHGTGKELFVGYLKVVAFYAVFTVCFLVAQRMGGQQAAAIVQGGFGLVVLVIVPYAIWGSRRYLLSRTSWRGVRFGLHGPARPFMGMFIGGYLLSLLTLGLYSPVWVNRMYRLFTTSSALGTQRFEYRGKDKDAFVIGVQGFLLSLVTLGVYSFWYRAALMRYQMSHTWFGGARGQSTITGGDLLVLTLLQLFALTATLGIAFPWVLTFSLNYTLERIRFLGPIDFGSVLQAPSSGDAAADDLADVLDVGLGI